MVFDGQMPVLSLALQYDTANFESVEEITRARVPLIKLRDVQTKLAVDISFNATSGTDNTAAVRRLLAEFPQVRPLALLLKYLLHQSYLNEPYYGGLGSYALVLMVVSFIQHKHKAAAAAGMPPPADLAYLLMDFIRLYGIDFNYTQTGISVRNGGSYFPKVKRGWLDPQRPYLLAVEDPEDPENDVGRNSFDIMSVRSLFASAHSVLGNALKRHERGQMEPSWLSHVILVHPQLQAYRAWTQQQYRITDNNSSSNGDDNGSIVISGSDFEDEEDDDNGGGGDNDSEKVADSTNAVDDPTMTEPATDHKLHR